MTLSMIIARNWMSDFHAKLFGLHGDSVRSDYFRFLANYKLIILAFNIVPYIALRIVQSA